MAGHRTLDHTADVALELWADDEPGLLLEGARAIVELLTEGEPLPERRAVREVHLDALDPEDRLVRWLNEVLVLAIAEGFCVTGGALALTEGGLAGRIEGAPDAATAIRTELKSVTYHDLVLTGGASGWTARVVIDV